MRVFEKVQAQVPRPVYTKPGGWCTCCRNRIVGLVVKALPMLFLLVVWLAQGGTAYAGATLTVNTVTPRTADNFLSLRGSYHPGPRWDV